MEDDGENKVVDQFGMVAHTRVYKFLRGSNSLPLQLVGYSSKSSHLF